MATEASETLFEAGHRELDKHGYLTRGGQIIDTSIVPELKQHLHKDEKALQRAGRAYRRVTCQFIHRGLAI